MKEEQPINGLPKEWKWVSFIEVAEVNPKIPSKELIPDELEVQFLPMKLVEELSGKIHLTETRLYGEVKKGYTPFINQDVLFAKVTPCMENGKIAVVDNLKNKIGFGSSEFHVVRSKQGLNNKFAFYYLIQKKFRSDAENAMTGAVGLRRVPKQFIENYRLPFPPLNEQQQIVSKIEELFSELDKGIEELKTAQQRLKVYRQAVLKWAFENDSENREEKLLSEVSDKIQIGPFGTQLHKEDYIEGGVPLINPMHIQDGLIVPNSSYSIKEEKRNSLPNYILQKGDVVMGRRGEMGRCGLVTEKEQGWFCGTGSLYVRPNTQVAEPKFLYHLLQSQPIKKYLEENAGGTTMANLNLKIVNNIPLHLPNLEEQQQIIQEIESRLSVCDKIEETINDSLKQAEALRQSILKDAFEGKLLVKKGPSFHHSK